MSKRINISVSDRLYEQIQAAKKGFSRDFSISKICQRAIENSITDALAFQQIWDDGFSVGSNYVASLTPKNQQLIKKMLNIMPRKRPVGLENLYIKAGLLSYEGAAADFEKHLKIWEYWKDSIERFQWMENEHKVLNDGRINILSWGGSVLLDDEQVDKRWKKIDEHWRNGLIAGLKEGTMNGKGGQS